MRKIKLSIVKALRIFVGISTALVLSFPAGISAPTLATGITVYGYVYKITLDMIYVIVYILFSYSNYSKNI